MTDQKGLVEDLTPILHKHGFERDEIADTITFLLSLETLRKLEKELDDLYAPPDKTEETT